eukprot:CAMPEP_0204911134 /NCGR_PEP_ID=MMETSP1397-20131031/9542_1 /ASSEMBLY_ACC=CAM_ASM_000891 /TAXON_ID=49980 /ORGANISM="Climacostomum Climacostomum virens, Strain Stock W-24" /LENGTH=217 /DNA_ID=CAMNT_0052081581 /DNA_START=1 /DNA_END=654 /DNA_ORIENTATION=+
MDPSSEGLPIESDSGDEFILEDCHASVEESVTGTEKASGRDKPRDLHVFTDAIATTEETTQTQQLTIDIGVDEERERPLNPQLLADQVHPLLQNTFSRYFQDPVHVNTICALCKASPIVGIRYKCMVCLNQDYCSNCEILHPHNMLVIRNPQPAIHIERPQKSESVKASELQAQLEDLERLGFSNKSACIKALFSSQFDINTAANILLEQSEPKQAS